MVKAFNDVGKFAARAVHPANVVPAMSTLAPSRAFAQSLSPKLGRKLGL